MSIQYRLTDFDENGVIPHDRSLDLTMTGLDALLNVRTVLPQYERTMVSISGGSDSDIVLDMVSRSGVDMTKVHFVFFDTGIEYEATKRHLSDLEERYGITIERLRARKTIPVCCREDGQPFLSKIVSRFMGQLQKNGFDWKDGPVEELLERYPNCKAAVKWWCNDYGKAPFNIWRNKWLKEFILENPPTFRIANTCCKHNKVGPATKYKREREIQLSITGMRFAEGGARAMQYKTCFTKNPEGTSEYRPIWWLKGEDKRTYAEVYGIRNSDCYTKYGLDRTGCAGCPMGRQFEIEMAAIEKYEPKLAKVVQYSFGDSLEYTRKYREFIREMDAKYGKTYHKTHDPYYNEKMERQRERRSS